MEQLNDLKNLWILNVMIYDLAYEYGICYLGKYGIAQTFAHIETTNTTCIEIARVLSLNYRADYIIVGVIPDSKVVGKHDSLRYIF